MKWLPVAAALMAVLLPATAQAHHAPSGWKYPAECCGNGDCQMLEPGAVKQTPGGWLIVETGEVIALGNTQESGDQDWHRCRFIVSNPGSKTRTSFLNGRPCLYIPEPDG